MPSALTAPPASLIAEKDRLRRSAGVRRTELALAQAPALAGAMAAERFLAEFRLPEGAIVSAYWPMGNELDPRPLIHRLQEAGHVVGLPVVVAKGEPLIFRAWTPETRFVPARVTDNRFNNPEYTKVLQGLTGWQKRAWLDGDGDIAAGQFFTTLRREVHVISSFDDSRAVEWFAAGRYQKKWDGSCRYSTKTPSRCRPGFPRRRSPTTSRC